MPKRLHDEKSFQKMRCSWSSLCMLWIPASEASNACLVILWNTLNLPFPLKLIWMRHWSLSSKLQVPHLWVLAQIFTISVVFLIEKSVCKGADLRLWIPVAGGFFCEKRTQNQERRLRTLHDLFFLGETSGVAAMGKKPAAQKMSLAAAWWWNQPFVLVT